LILTMKRLALAQLLAIILRENILALASSFCEEDGWDLLWSDEFDGEELDLNTWTIDVGPARHDSRTRDARATKDSVFVHNGALIIRSNATWNGTGWENLTSGAIWTQNKVSFRGPTRVCVSAKLPGGGAPHKGSGTGIWPAHWLMPNLDDSCWPCRGEIDILEMIDGDGRSHATYHWCLNETCGPGKPHHQSSGGTLNISSVDWANEWHEYAVEYGHKNIWQTTSRVVVAGGGHPSTTARIQFAFDGVIYHRVNDQAIVFDDVPYYAILNTAVGGSWPHPPNIHDHGSKQQFARRRVLPLRHTVFPTYHFVDWIRVAQPSRASLFRETNSQQISGD
jgi:beta-glucanase (GH16 family)